MLGLGASLSAGAPPGDPSLLEIGNISLWLKNDTAVTAAAWRDNSGLGKDASQATSGNQATVQQGGLEFDGSDDHYDLANNGVQLSENEGFTIFVAVQPDNVSTKTVLSVGNTTGFMEFLTAKKFRLRFDNDTAIGWTSDTSVFAVDTKYLLTVEREAGEVGQINIYVNGELLTPTSQVGDAGPGTFDTLSERNSDRYFDGHIFELLVYDGGNLTDGEKAIVHADIMNRLSIS
mgnify:CR=1 FL=1